MQESSAHPHLWSVILAGGEGERTRPWIESWLGRHRPKQYCTFVGSRSMFQHTVDRADRLTLPGHRVAVIASSHAAEVGRQLAGRDPGIVALQPANRDTGSGALLALAHVRALDPSATVVIYPSDHFIYPEDRFIEVVSRAVSAAESLDERLVLLGVEPDRPETDYGWMETGPAIETAGAESVWSVRSFLEKPSEARARRAMDSGALWNTLVLAARVQTIWRMGWRCIPELMHHFEHVSRIVGTPLEQKTIDEIYRYLPSRSFSSDLLARIPERIAAIELQGVLWSDWGTPDRILETLRTIGKERTLACAVSR